MTQVAPDPHHPRLVRRVDGPLREFNRAGVLDAADVHVALRLGRLGGEDDQDMLLAAALAVRAVRSGSVCLDLTQARDTVPVEDADPELVAALRWPEPAAWLARVRASGLVGDGEPPGGGRPGELPGGLQGRPLRLSGGLLYLDRYWRQEELVASEVDARAAQAPPVVDRDALLAGLSRLFPSPEPDRQRLAAAVAALRWVTVLAGGPGTGKTTTVAKLLALLQQCSGPGLRIALAAPTGKAAARLQQAVQAEVAALSAADRHRLGPLTASTVHRLLGFRPGARTRFRHDRDNRLPFDVVVVDEASMVSLTLMSRLVEALRRDTRLVLVGDPDQLASVEAGAVLGDLVARPPLAAGGTPGLGTVAARDLADLSGEDATILDAGTVRLRRVFRFSGDILTLADAVRTDRADDVMALLDSGSSSVELVEWQPGDRAGLAGVRADVVDAGAAMVAAARAGQPAESLALLDRHRLMCGHREGAYGVSRWGEQVETWLGEAVEGYAAEGPWYVGRPLLVSVNDYELRLFNGDTGVVIDVGGRPRAVFAAADGLVTLPPGRLSQVQTVHAMTVHRSQGSQFGRVTLVLPPADSPLLTRELLYTAVTRAREHVRIVGSREAVRAAVGRPIVRASGLRSRR